MSERDKSRRFVERSPSKLKVKVNCRETVDEEWEEITQLIDCSRLGARFTVGRRVESGQLLHLSFAMPTHLRVYDRTAAQYQIWSVVRDIEELEVQDLNVPRFEVGVALIGQDAPAGFESDPTKRYELKPVPGRHGLWEARERSRKEFY